MPQKARKPLHVLFVGESEEESRTLRKELRRADYDLSFERVHTREMMTAALGRQAWDIVLTDDAVPEIPSAFAQEALEEGKAADHRDRGPGTQNLVPVRHDRDAQC